jgi:hypothetical protein
MWSLTASAREASARMLSQDRELLSGGGRPFRDRINSKLRFPLASTAMIWILWALMLIAHGAISRWAQTARSYAKVSALGDVLLIAVALITIDQLQGLGIEETLRVGLFFTAFGWVGRQLMGSVLKSPA